MAARPLLLLHGIRGSRLAEFGAEPEVLWQLSNEHHPRVARIALHWERGEVRPLLPGPPVGPLDLEQEIYGPFLERFAARGPLIAPAWDWRLAPAEALAVLPEALPADEPLDVVTHSMGLQLLAEAVVAGRLPVERLGRLVLVTPPFRGSIDSYLVLRSGCDRNPTGAGEDATGAAYGMLVRGFPALYRLLPAPGSGLVVDATGREPDLLDAAAWPQDQTGEEGRHAETLRWLLDGARRDRARLDRFVELLAGPLARRTLVLLAAGLPTPSRLRLAGDGSEPQLSFCSEGDGRLVPSSARPPRPGPTVDSVGGVGDPVAHGEVMRRPDALARIAGWLEAG
jgi:hypothetical protein